LIEDLGQVNLQFISIKDEAVKTIQEARDGIEKEIKSIYRSGLYRPGMALYTFNGDSQRYWELKRRLELL